MDQIMCELLNTYTHIISIIHILFYLYASNI